MLSERKKKIIALLKGIETGDPAAVTVVNTKKYIQHNPQTHEGSEGLAALFKRLSKSSPRVNIVRIFEDGDYVFAHTEYEFSSSKIGFEVFRYEGEFVVEHWDNIQERQGPNSSGHSMVSGPSEAVEHVQTEKNRRIVRTFIEDILIGRQLEKLHEYIDQGTYIEHNPQLADGEPALRSALTSNDRVVEYKQIHRVLAEGNFVLCVGEGSTKGAHSAFYDLFRLNAGKLIEHWDTIETIAPQHEWKNDNGKF